MEYSEIYNNNFIKHVGYSDGVPDEQSCAQIYFSQQNVTKLSKKITELLMGVEKNNRPIVVPDTNISNVMSTVYDNYIPEIGDIHTRYIIVNKNTNQIDKMNDTVINIIVTNIKNELEIEENNKKLTIWTTVLGDFNKHGLMSHSKIKLREKRPQSMAFNMNY